MSIFNDKNNEELIAKVEELENNLINIARLEGKQEGSGRQVSTRRRAKMEETITDFLNELEAEKSED